MTKILLSLYILLLASCSSYVRNIHSQFDAEQRNRRLRYQRMMDKRPIQNPVTLGQSRNYQAQMNNRRYYAKGKRRTKADDLKDNSGDGSLWSGKNSESFLFVTNNLKRKGDIVIIEVFAGLKGKIQEELKRMYPDPKPRKKKNAKEEAPPAEEPAVNATTPDDPNKVYDKISTTVVERMNQDYLLIRGRKEILYKKFKRYFEIQAIVSQKDISSQDTIGSQKLLEPKINVLRY